MLKHASLPKLELHCTRMDTRVAQALFQWAGTKPIWGCFELIPQIVIPHPHVPLEFTTHFGSVDNPQDLLKKAQFVEQLITNPSPYNFQFQWFLFLTTRS